MVSGQWAGKIRFAWWGQWERHCLVVYGIDKLLKPNFLEILSVAGKKGFHPVGFQGDAQHNIVRLRC